MDVEDTGEGEEGGDGKQRALGSLVPNSGYRSERYNTC